jgi:Tol biopolymer transport system component
MSKRIPVTIVCVVVAATIALIATRWLVPSSAVRAGDELGEGDIIVLPVNPSNAVQGDKFRPQWGPDLEPECSKFGDYIVFELNDTTYEAHHLYLYQFRAGGDVGPYPLIDIDNANDPDVDRLNPQWSPDGNWIIFSKVVNGYSQIFRAALRESDQDDYSTEIQITSGSTNHRNARWSPSTSVNLIVFERDVSGVSKIFKQCPTSLGSNPVQLTTGTKDDHRPVWNRTATRVVFER